MGAREREREREIQGRKRGRDGEKERGGRNKKITNTYLIVLQSTVLLQSGYLLYLEDLAI